MHVTEPVDDLHSDDRFAHPTPISSGTVNIGRENSGDALRIMRRHCREREAVGQESLHDITHTSAAPESHLHVREIFRDDTAIIVERDERVIRHDSVVERVSRPEKRIAFELCTRAMISCSVVGRTNWPGCS